MIFYFKGTEKGSKNDQSPNVSQKNHKRNEGMLTKTSTSSNQLAPKESNFPKQALKYNILSLEHAYNLQEIKVRVSFIYHYLLKQDLF